jgi:glucokinase
MHYLTIDLGGTKTAVSVGDASGQLGPAHRMPTEADLNPQRWRERLEVLIRETLDEAGLGLRDLHAVGLAVPGPMSVREGLVLEPPNMPAWRHIPVRSWIEELTGRPVHLNNDANAAALAEYRFGAFRGVPDLVYLTLSTGIGGGIISGGHLLQGSRDLAGEVGHMVLDPEGPHCPCGQRGCLEMYCGGRNVLQQVRAELAGGAASCLRNEASDLTISALARAAERGDALARRYWETFLDRLAQGIGIMLMCYNPSAVIMGTIAIHLGDLLLHPLRERLPQFAWKQSRQDVHLAASQLGSRIGDLGALALALEPRPTPP